MKTLLLTTFVLACISCTDIPNTSVTDDEVKITDNIPESNQEDAFSDEFWMVIGQSAMAPTQYKYALSFLTFNGEDLTIKNISNWELEDIEISLKCIDTNGNVTYRTNSIWTLKSGEIKNSFVSFDFNNITSITILSVRIDGMYNDNVMLTIHSTQES